MRKKEKLNKWSGVLKILHINDLNMILKITIFRWSPHFYDPNKIINTNKWPLQTKFKLIFT